MAAGQPLAGCPDAHPPDTHFHGRQPRAAQNCGKSGLKKHLTLEGGWGFLEGVGPDRSMSCQDRERSSPSLNLPVRVAVCPVDSRNSMWHAVGVGHADAWQ